MTSRNPADLLPGWRVWKIILPLMFPFSSHADQPMQMFRDWLALAEQTEVNDPNAAALATATSGGVPSVRMVLVKGTEDRGLRFFTNGKSQKGSELHANPMAALCLHWKSLRRQVRFQGPVQELGRDETEVYFHSRGRGSQLAAAISAQSRPLASRQQMDEAVQALAASLGDAAVPLPVDWTGFLLVPQTIEFWSDGADRLHDRLRFTRSGESWGSQRLYP